MQKLSLDIYYGRMSEYKAIYRDKVHQYEDALNRFLSLMNAGGAATVLAFIGTSNVDTPAVAIPLVFFVGGLILAGWSLYYGMRLNIENIQNDVLPSRETEREIDKYVSLHGGAMGKSFAFFVLGSVSGTLMVAIFLFTKASS
ncbi:hypothetical protein RJ527_14590 [Thalassospiraceae bacterium LMO-SO8]|nr:hypothetical protein [Alphaproteobacteria bacterium LMO-S08]WND75252.1 hypothetical protein RJ527_14590 [Thalassospiraceae bacterium LMO-SO8]